MSSNLPGESERLSSLVNAQAAPPVASPVEPAVFSGEEHEESGSSLNLARYIAAVLRYKWMILGLAVAGTAAGVVASRRIEPTYIAQVTIWVETPERGQLAQGPIQSGQLLQSSAWIDLLRSFAVLDPVVEELRLYLRPRLAADSLILADFAIGDDVRAGAYRLTKSQDGGTLRLTATDGTLIEEVQAGDSVGRDLGFIWRPDPALLRPGQSVDFTVRHPRDAARGLTERIVARIATREANFLSLQMSGTNPDRIAKTLNAVAHRFVDVAAELKNRKLNEFAEILNEQLTYAEENLRQAEIELESFRVQTVTLPTERATPVAPGLAETRDPVFDNFFSLKIEQEQLRRDREAIAAALAQAADSSLAIAGLEYIGAVRGSSELMRALQMLAERRAELNTLRAQYTDEYLPVRQLIGQISDLETRVIPRLARDLMEHLATREAHIEGMIRGASTELQQIPPRQLEEMRLRRRVAIAENLYTTLRQRYETAKLAAASAIPDLRILDEAARPQRPVSDPRSQIILVAFMGSLGLGLLGAIVLDRFDRRFRHPEEVTRGLRLNILGAIPEVRSRNGKARPDATTHAIEAFRELRLSLVHAHGSAGPLLTTITSAGSGDGKSFVSANLALSFADQGHRTLLIDADLRRGGQHRLFGCDRKPGLTDLLSGGARLEDVIRKTSSPMLHLIASGTRMQAAPELLGSPAMADLMRTLRSRYSVILIDSPPLGAGVDAFVLGTLAGSLALVFRTGYTDREFAEAKLHLLDRLPVRILGAVLNAVPPTGVYRYYTYLPGYESVGEEEGELVKMLPGL